jgi:hypothetical protein
VALGQSLADSEAASPGWPTRTAPQAEDSTIGEFQIKITLADQQPVCTLTLSELVIRTQWHTSWAALLSRVPPERIFSAILDRDSVQRCRFTAESAFVRPGPPFGALECGHKRLDGDSFSWLVLP